MTADEAFDMGWEEASWPPEELQRPITAIRDHPDLMSAWCAGVEEAWAIYFEIEAENKGCNCCPHGSYHCPNHAADPQHAHDARRCMDDWRTRAAP